MPPPLTARAGAAAGISILMTHHLWLTWGHIAVEQLALARTARAQALRAHRGHELLGDRGRGFGPGLDAELRASLVSITASAFAIDGFYGSAGALIPVPAALTEKWETNKTGRASRIIETLKQGFRLGGRQGWERDLQRLFSEMRNPGVHFVEEAKPPAPHPMGLTNVSAESARYAFENAQAATELMVWLLNTAVYAPREHLPELVTWAERMRGGVTKLETSSAVI